MNAGVISLEIAPRDHPIPTSVDIGDGVLEAFLSRRAGERSTGAKCLFVVDAGVARSDVQREWGESRIPLDDALVVPAGERAKSREVLARIQDAILDRALTREDVVIAVGGGAVLDVTGFAAATTRRGMPWIAVPTSVVAVADASIGGKTGINHAQGKNLIGAFHPPVAVCADMRTLTTLAAREFISGLAEVYKAGVVGDASILATLRTGVPTVGPALAELLARAVRVKAALVELDLHDTGVRRALNYGHTIGHALETALGPDEIRHGEAVAIGMGVAAEIARARGAVDAAFVARQDADLEALALPTVVPRSADGTRVRLLVFADKKRRATATHTMVLPRAHGGVDVVGDVTNAELDAALDARRATR